MGVDLRRSIREVLSRRNIVPSQRPSGTKFDTRDKHPTRVHKVRSTSVPPNQIENESDENENATDPSLAGRLGLELNHH